MRISIPTYIIANHIILYHIILYHIILYHIILYHIMSYHIMSCHVMSCHAMSRHAMSCHMASYLIVSYRIVSYHIRSYHTISCHIISRHIVSCHIYHIYIHTYLHIYTNCMQPSQNEGVPTYWPKGLAFEQPRSSEPTKTSLPEPSECSGFLLSCSVVDCMDNQGIRISPSWGLGRHCKATVGASMIAKIMGSHCSRIAIITHT